jgi:hypothetical protein
MDIVWQKALRLLAIYSSAEQNNNGNCREPLVFLFLMGTVVVIFFYIEVVDLAATL